MAETYAVDFLLRPSRTRRSIAIFVILGLVVGWALAFFGNEETQLVCERRAGDASCVVKHRWPIGESDRVLSVSQIAGAVTQQRQVKNGTRYDVVLLVPGERDAAIDTFYSQPGADQEAKAIAAFLHDPSVPSFATAADPNGPSFFLTAVIATPIMLVLALITVLLLESATVIVDPSRRRIRLVRHFVLFRTTRELPLDEVAGVMVQNTNVATKGGWRPVSNAWLVRPDGTQLAAVHFDWAGRGMCDEPAQRLDALVKQHTRAVAAPPRPAPPGPDERVGYREPGRAPTELDSLASHPPPRDRSFAEPYVRKLAPASSFILMGLGFAYLSMCAWTGVFVGSLLAYVAVAHVSPPPGWLVLVTLILGIAAFVGLWVGFIAIVRRARTRAARLLTHGTLVDGTFSMPHVVAGDSVRASGWTIGFTPPGGAPRVARVIFHGTHVVRGGERCAVLYEPSQKKVIVFQLDGDGAGSSIVGTL